METASTSRTASQGVGLPANVELEWDIHRIDHALAALSCLPASESEQDADVLWLVRRRRFLRSVLAWRGTMRAEKIVSLESWRTGGLDVDEVWANVAQRPLSLERADAQRCSASSSSQS